MIRNYLEIAERAETGPKVKKADWDFDYIVEMTQEVVDKYQLSWDADTLTPDDPDLANRIFNAGRDLIIKGKDGITDLIDLGGTKGGRL